jgi:class 3 adenylate cyclase
VPQQRFGDRQPGALYLEGGVEPPLGDVVNTTARLASAASAGEVIVSVAGAEAAGADGLERRTVEIRGRAAPVEVVVLRPADVEIGAGS